MIERRKNAVLVPGFASDGGPWQRNVQPTLQAAGWQTYQVSARKRYFLRVRLCDGNIAEAVAALTPPGAVGWGHSDGCNILRQAANLGAPFSQLVLINPALDADAEIAAQVRVIHVWHSPADWVVRIGGLLLWHPWGTMGAEGYKGRTQEGQVVVNYNLRDHFPGGARGHTDALKDDIWPVIGPVMIERVEYYREKLLRGKPL